MTGTETSRPAGAARQLVIFDCDGVLVDSEVLVSEAEAELLAEVGVSLTPQEIADQFVGLSEQELTRRIQRQWGVVLDEHFSAAKTKRVTKLLATTLQPVAGIADVLASLKVPVCVASSSNPERVRLSLEKTALARFFGDHVFTASMVKRGKPAPDLFLLAASAMGVAPGQCIVVEDSPFGVTAGVAANMHVIGFTGGGHCVASSAGRLRQAGAMTIASNTAELGGALSLALSAHP